jgi:hypothetical protein
MHFRRGLTGAVLASACAALWLGSVSASAAENTSSTTVDNSTATIDSAFPGCTNRWSADGGVYVQNRSCGRPIKVKVWFTDVFDPWGPLHGGLCKSISTGGTTYYPGTTGWYYHHIELC